MSFYRRTKAIYLTAFLQVQTSTAIFYERTSTNYLYLVPFVSGQLMFCIYQSPVYFDIFVIRTALWHYNRVRNKRSLVCFNQHCRNFDIQHNSSSSKISKYIGSYAVSWVIAVNAQGTASRAKLMEQFKFSIKKWLSDNLISRFFSLGRKKSFPF